jgi:DegV family protein with EDD domain
VVQIITDSTTDLDKRILGQYELMVLPLTITIDNVNYLDGKDIQVEQVYEVMRKKIVPKTSQIPMEYFYNVFRQCAMEGKDIIYISFSKEMSSCFSVANMVAQEIREEYPHISIDVVDSEGGSSATGLIVWQALQMAKQGLHREEILANVKEMIQSVVHVFSVADLEWMALGGRINKPMGMIGSKLKIQPWLMVEEGKMVVKGMVRGRRKAIEKVAEETVKRALKSPDQLIAITHADDLDAAKQLEERIKQKLPQCKTTITHIGGVLGVHIGISGIGVFFFSSRPSWYQFDEITK